MTGPHNAVARVGVAMKRVTDKKEFDSSVVHRTVYVLLIIDKIFNFIFSPCTYTGGFWIVHPIVQVPDSRVA